MVVLLALVAVIGGILVWVLRAHGTVKAVREIDQDTKGLQRRVKHVLQDVIGSPLQRVRDPRLAATILMIQLVRTGSPVTASEKTKILELMEERLGVESTAAMFEKAWSLTVARRPFSLVADELLPLFREQLTPDERTDLVEMLEAVAKAYGAASELQREAITRLRRLLRDQRPSDRLSDDSAA